MLYLTRLFYSEEHGVFNNFHSILAERVNINRLQIVMKKINAVY